MNDCNFKMEGTVDFKNSKLNEFMKLCTFMVHILMNAIQGLYVMEFLSCFVVKYVFS